jgi:hypothetical protein
MFRAFSLFGERGKFIISGGNDKSVKVWDWSTYLDAREANGNSEPPLNINLSKKVSSYCIFFSTWKLIKKNFLDSVSCLFVWSF